ncbi:MAG: hypothetical protein LBL82_01410 [Oscillospiraceae bacterium]|nr:hypothetical protein [Oscillospiraceae bacterium]
MSKLNNFSKITSDTIAEAIGQFGSPFYLYDEHLLKEKCREVLSMPNAYGLNVRFAMKANSGRSVLKIVDECGLMIDASSLNEAKRANLAGIDYSKITLTTQEVPEGEERKDLEEMMLRGLKYNVCSMRQLALAAPFARENKINLSIRVHPGVGGGESASRNTGDDYSCFGIHRTDFQAAVDFAKDSKIKFDKVHVHIGSGADPIMWQNNIDLELDIIERYFPDAETVCFGGGLKEARLPGEKCADVTALGEYAKLRITEFYEKTGRKLKMEIEPGTYVAANFGYAVTKIIDKKRTGENGLNFFITDGGMEINARPIMYGSSHPFYIISADGKLLYSDWLKEYEECDYEAVVVGRCCESGDSQCLDAEGRSFARKMSDASIGDIMVIGGTGAYCSSMTPFNYNSHTQIPEVLATESGELRVIRKRQTLLQILENEA